MLALVSLIAVLAIAWFWLDTAAARDGARAAARRLCGALGVQFLDQSVALAQTRLRRDETGRLRWERVFQFEFSESGNERYPGRVQILGREPAWVMLNGARIGQVLAEGDQLQ